MRIRRVVTGNGEQGTSVVISDGHSPRELVLQHFPGFVSSPIWTTTTTPTAAGAASDPIASGGTLLAPPGGSTFLVVTFPPDSVAMSPQFDPEKAGAEHAIAAPGIAETFEPDSPGMHRTPTLDYVTVIKGEIVLELDEGRTITLRAGDTVVQHGVRHAWRNPGSEPATVSFVMLGLADAG